MSKGNVVEFAGREEIGDPLTELLRRGARELIQRAVEAELSEFMAEFQDRQLEDGRAAVVRNGYQPEREIQTGIGPVTVQVPKVRAKDGRPVTFRSALVPPSKDTITGSCLALAVPASPAGRWKTLWKSWWGRKRGACLPARWHG